MSSPNLDSLVHDRFREAFGEPRNALGNGEHWSLRPDRAVDIHVMLNGAVGRPGVWVFDPNDHSDGIVNTLIGHEGEIELIINQIRERVARADLQRAMNRSA
jgi:hypothetical protein